MRKRRPAHATTVTVRISAGANDEIFGHTLRPYAVATNFQPASVVANEASGTSDTAGKAARVAVERSGSCRDTRGLRRQKNFSGVRIFHRRAGRKTAHIDVTAVR